MLKELLERDELIMKLNSLGQIAEELSKNIAITEKLKEDIEKEDLDKKEIIFKISNEILMSNKGYFLVRLGNIFLEKNREQVLAYLEKRKEVLNRRIQDIKKEMEKITKRIEELTNLTIKL